MFASVRNAFRSKARKVVALTLTLTALGAGLIPTSASAAPPTSCAIHQVSLYRPTGATFAAQASGKCSAYFYMRVQVKESGRVIRDNSAATWSAPWMLNSVYTNPSFYCTHGLGYQAVAIVYFWNGTGWAQAGYWTTGAPQALC